MNSIWDVDKIKETLPHRAPFLFIDQVLEVDIENERVTCLKNIDINDYFFQGHFPGNPVMPGVIMVEAMAQASIILFATLKPEIAKTKPDYFLGKVDAKFSRVVKPGDQLIIKVTKEKMMSNAGVVQAQALVNDEVAVSARIFFGVKKKT